jgi:HK97 family phage prohead protease
MDHDKLTAMLDAGLLEFRSVPFLDFESTDDGWGFRGLAGVYEEPADIGDFTEEFARGAYRRAIASGDNTRLAYDHSPRHVPVLATLHAKTMALKDDARGLDVRASIAKHYIGEAARELIRRGDIKGMSPGMTVGRGNSEVTMRGDKPHRVIRNLKHLHEVSITPDPAYAGTTAEMRSMWAFQMAESMGLPQHALAGAYPQLEGRATDLEADTGKEPAKAEACETCGSEPCACEPAEEQRSGVDDSSSAARRRRLQMMGLSLPA